MNASLITGLNFPIGISAFDGKLYVVTDTTSGGNGKIGVYDATTGATINAALVSGLAEGYGIEVVPEPTSIVLAALGLLGVATWARRRRS